MTHETDPSQSHSRSGALVTSLELDLRPLLTGGTDPLQPVSEQAGRIAAGGTLVLTAPFNPVPLRRVLGRMGFSSTAGRTADGAWRIDCRRDGAGRIDGDAATDRCRGPVDVGAPVWEEDDGIHIDVRGMAPPRPLLSILRLCAGLGAGRDVIVHHDRDPVFLYSRLADLGWTADVLASGSGEGDGVRLRLCKEGWQ